ncbi:unnamed protein product, partial [Allacma fusca]
MNTRICFAFVCLLAALISVSECTQKKKSEGLLVIQRCMGKRVPSHKYTEAVKACKGKKTEMCSYMCMANRMHFIKNNKIMDKEQKEYIEEVLPHEATKNVYKEIVKCRKHYVEHDKDSECQGNHDWAKCNKAGEKRGCKES